MVSNRLISNLKSIRQATDSLRINLINGGVSAGIHETLPNLVGKVPLLYNEPLPTPPEEEWSPDPLWLFPDPNGTETPKTIEEIYNEDLMAGDYTYRAIYMINGAFPTTNLRGGRTSGHVITYITSDGATYTDTTGTTLEHTWDTTKDVIDSNGNPVRYIKVYTNTAQTTVQNFDNTLVWVVYNLGTTISGGSSQNSNNGFNHNYSLQSVTIPEGVTSIGQRAFQECSSLQSIIIPEGVTSIGIYAFYNCSSLQSIIIPDSVTSIGVSAFQNCYALQSVIIPEGVSSIETSAFQNCYALQSVIIPDSVTSIGSNIFQNCYSLISVILPFEFNTTGLNLTQSTQLSPEAIVDMFANLKDLTGQTAKTITIGTVNKNKLTTEQLEIATNKNWTVA